MVETNSVQMELEEQRCLIEQQQVQIRRLLRYIQLQAEVTTVIQAELDAIKVTLQSNPQPKRRSRSSGHAHAGAYDPKWA